MLAETAYSVIQALPDAERSRLYVMLEEDKKKLAVATEPSKFKSNEEYQYEILQFFAKWRTDRKQGQALKIVK